VNYLSEIARDIANELPDELVPVDDADGLMLVYALLCCTLGVDVSRRHVHDAWTAWMACRGQEHESMVPYDQLPRDVQLEDEPFAEAIRGVALRLASA